MEATISEFLETCVKVYMVLKSKIFAACLLIVAQFCWQQSATAQCNCPDSIKKAYRYAAAQSILFRAELEHNKSVLDSFYVSNDSINEVIKGLCAIYNDTAINRDSIYSIGKIFTNSNFLSLKNRDASNLFRCDFITDTTNTSIRYFYKNANFGNSRIDNYFKKCKISVNLLKSIGKYYGKIVYDTFVNFKRVKQDIDALIPNLIFTQSGFGDGPYWYTYGRKDTVVYAFQARWGDCPAGCIYNRSWYYLFSKDCQLKGPFFDTFPPLLRSKPIYININNKDVVYCENKIPHYNHSIQTNTRFQNELGGVYGNWYLNDQLIDNYTNIQSDSFGTFVLKHIPFDTLGVYVTSTVKIRKETQQLKTGFFNKDTIYTCSNKLLDLHNYLTDNARKLLDKSSPHFLQTNQIKTIDLDVNRHFVQLFIEGLFCEFHDSVTIVREELQTASGLPDSVKVQFGDSVLLKPDSFWKKAIWRENGFEISTQLNLQLKNNLILETGHRKLFVELFNQDSCKSTFAVSIDFLKPVALHWNKKSNAYFIYPNPANKVLYISDLDRGKFTVNNLQGTEVLSGDCTNTGINISNLKSGVYLLFLNKEKTFLFIKQ